MLHTAIEYSVYKMTTSVTYKKCMAYLRESDDAQTANKPKSKPLLDYVGKC